MRINDIVEIIIFYLELCFVEALQRIFREAVGDYLLSRIVL